MQYFSWNYYNIHSKPKHSSISEFNYDEYTTRWLTLLTTMNYALTFFRNYLEFKLLWILIMSFWRLKNFSKWLLTFFFHFNRIQFELFKSIAIKWYRLQGIILFYLFISNNFCQKTKKNWFNFISWLFCNEKKFDLGLNR